MIADITDATEVRAELHNVVRDFTSLPVQPIMLHGQPEFVSLSHLRRFPWLLPTFEYDSQEHLLANLDKSVVDLADFKLFRSFEANRGHWQASGVTFRAAPGLMIAVLQRRARIRQQTDGDAISFQEELFDLADRLDREAELAKKD